MADEINMHFSSVFMKENTSSLRIPKKGECWGSSL